MSEIDPELERLRDRVLQRPAPGRLLPDDAVGKTITKIVEHPACVEFYFSDATRLTLWEGDNEHGREWQWHLRA